MTYLQLYEYAIRMFENGKITVGEYIDMIKPLNNEVCEEGEWIPVSKRVPDEAKVVLACNKNGIMMIGHIFVCHNGECQAYTNDDEMDWVIAWMPLPEPYREDGEE